MLGIYLIICMAIYWLIRLKIYSLFKDEHIEPVELDSKGRTYNICNRAVILLVISLIVILMGYIGCAWPYLFVEGIAKSDYIFFLATFGLCPVLGTAYACYVNIKSRQGYIRISRDEIEYKRYKSFFIKVGDIKKISYPYRIHFKEKGKKPLPGGACTLTIITCALIMCLNRLQTAKCLGLISPVLSGLRRFGTF